MRLSFKVVERVKKDPELEIFALDFEDGYFYATARKGGKWVVTKLRGSEVVAERRFKEELSGVCAADEFVYVVAKEKRVCFVLRESDLSPVRTLNCCGEEVSGIASDSDRLIMTDGGQSLFWYKKENCEFEAALTFLSDLHLRFGDLTVIGNKAYIVDLDRDRVLRADFRGREIEAFIDLSSERPKDRAGVSAVAGDGTFLYVTGPDWPEILKLKVRK